LLRMGETDRALGVFTRAEEVASAMIVEERTPFRVGRARCLFQLGDFSGALHLLESHLAGLRASEGADPTAFLQVYAALIPPYFAAGYLERARDVASKGLELASRVPDPEQRACFYVNRAGLLLTQGEPRDALASLALAEDLFRQLGWHAETVKVGLMRAMAFIEQDDLAVAEGVLREVLDNGGDAMTKSDRVQALNHLAHVRRRSGHPEEAVTLTSASIKLAGTKFPNLVAEAYREAGLAHVAAGEQDKAVTLWRRALKLYQKLGNHEDIAKTARLIGDLLMESGRTQEAVDIYRSGLGSMGDLR
jgi:tetratricopeptide (TPR) repeat protein